MWLRTAESIINLDNVSRIDIAPADRLMIVFPDGKINIIVTSQLELVVSLISMYLRERQPLLDISEYVRYA